VKRVFFDIDTQIDFMYPAGALYVPGAERIVPTVAKLNHYAAASGAALLSDMCAHSENDAEFRDWPPHCVVGTTGQLKPQSTMLEKRAVVPNQPADIRIEDAQQIILEKQELNLFTNPNLAKLLEILAADEYFVYGVVTEYCVSYAALGLLATGKPVTLITDAIRCLSDADAERTIRTFTSRGGALATSSEVLGSV
jgi:nicotinamidase/pyrazinamidase